MADPVLVPAAPIATGSDLLPLATADIDSFQEWVNTRQVRAGGEPTKLLSIEKSILLDYIYFTWERSRG